MTQHDASRQTEPTPVREAELVSAPTVRRRQLGRTLRAMREQLGLKQEDVALRTDGAVNRAKLSRIETALTAATAADVGLILDALDCTEDDLRTSLLKLTREGARRGWWQSYRSVLSSAYEDLISLESEADHLSAWQPTVIPGLLQTGEYAQQIIAATAMSTAAEDRVDALVEVRLARQSVLTREAPLNLWAIIGEAALRTRCADSQIMYDQLNRLVTMSGRPTITIQVLPSNAAPHVGQMGAFSILGYGTHADLSVVHVESLTSALYVEERTDVAVYQDAVQQLRAAALSVDESRQMIREIRDQQ
ncbi:helix-turn-helix domain-containing protein [Streptomyces sp. JV184]|uniref:helix-turn-helix domain-containing protein n=1 Tax=Streptomyces sp. JV184 TaxID=858637 RepID=UPI002E75BA68|nr:helix-turn-helix transcriptional regulator [Streptomyces sp. JV184]MEE1749166.1 helix-turn-helix transcriptional regulator [Streptomyces sp. JV184]